MVPRDTPTNISNRPAEVYSLVVGAITTIRAAISLLMHQVRSPRTSRLRTPSHAFAPLRTPSHAFALLVAVLTPSVVGHHARLSHTLPTILHTATWHACHSLSSHCMRCHL